jgi:hypothetical protein
VCFAPTSVVCFRATHIRGAGFGLGGDLNCADNF